MIWYVTIPVKPGSTGNSVRFPSWIEQLNNLAPAIISLNGGGSKIKPIKLVHIILVSTFQWATRNLSASGSTALGSRDVPILSNFNGTPLLSLGVTSVLQVHLMVQVDMLAHMIQLVNLDCPLESSRNRRLDGMLSVENELYSYTIIAH